MQQRQPTLDLQFLQVLEEWCEVVGARGARLLLRPSNSTCPCGLEVQPSRGSYRACMVQGPCPLQSTGQGKILVQAGGPFSQVSQCVTCALLTGDILSLQIHCPEGPSTDLLSPVKLARLASPILMAARATWELQTLEARLEEAQERNRTELHAAIRAQEDEREWLALEVHDRLAQTLATVFQQLQTLESLGASSPEIRRVAVRGSILCREVIREARNIMNDLRPPVLDELGLVPLVQEELLRHLEQEASCQVQQRISYPVRPPRDVELVLYRIFHEALINIQRHSKATKVIVSLDGDGEAVRLQVEDNGVGFNVGEALAKKRVGGLMSIQRRAELAGGISTIESEPGGGTKVTARIPVAGGQPSSRRSNEQ